MIRRLRLKFNQKGITLLEVIVATALTGVIIGVLGPMVYDILWHSDRSNAQIEAVCNIEEAARWISNDGQSAQSLDLTDPVNPGLSWVDATTGDLYAITYSLSGTDLYRTEVINSGTPSARIVVGEIDSFAVTTGSTVSPAPYFEVSLTSSGGNSELNETREYYVTRRAIY